MNLPITNRMLKSNTKSVEKLTTKQSTPSTITSKSRTSSSYGEAAGKDPITTALLTIENFFKTVFRELSRNFPGTFQDFYRGTVDFSIWACK